MATEAIAEADETGTGQPLISQEPPRTVIIAVDGSHTAEHAFDWYYNHLHLPENRVIVVHTIEVIPKHTVPSLFTRPEVYQAEFEKEKLKSTGMEELYVQKMKDKLMNGTFESLAGKPGETIIHFANEKRAELIVTGTRGHGTIRRTILGSVSDYIVHHAHCAVAAVRKNQPL